jgi:nucleoside-diphosphate-sugar epimerase
MRRSNDKLLDEVFPKTKRKRAIEATESLISIEKARTVLGYKPKYTWRKAGAARAKTGRKRK